MKFPDGWKIIKLNDVAVPLNRRNTIGNRNVLTSSAQFGLINQLEYHNRSMAGEDLSSYYLLCNGDFAYNRSSAKGYPFGAIRRLDKYDTGIVSSLYIPFALKKDSCFSDFLSYVLDSDVINQYLYRVCQEGARNHGLLNIAKEDFFQMPLYFPICKNEQRRIAEFLGTWDEAIEKLERLIAAKEKRFRGLIQRSLAFKKSEHISFSKIFDVISEKNQPELPLLSVTQNNGVIPRDMLEGRVWSPEGSLEGYKVVQKNDFVVSLRSFQGGLEYSLFTGLISPAYTVLRARKKVAYEFYRFFFKSYIFIHQYLDLAVIGIRDGKQISIPDLLTIAIPFPDIKKQKNIAFELGLNEKEINLLKKKIAVLQNQKRGLMQKLLTGTWRV